MSGNNHRIRDELERIYGKGCMFQKAKVAERLEKLGVTPTYKQFKKHTKYTLKEIRFYETQMNLHHLKHRAEGGDTSVENGAVINTIAHQYLHTLSRQDEEIANNMLREYKKCKLEFVDLSIKELTDLDIKMTEISFSSHLKANEIEIEKKKREDKIKMQKLKKEYEDR